MIRHRYSSEMQKGFDDSEGARFARQAPPPLYRAPALSKVSAASLDRGVHRQLGSSGFKLRPATPVIVCLVLLTLIPTAQLHFLLTYLETPALGSIIDQPRSRSLTARDNRCFTYRAARFHSTCARGTIDIVCCLHSQPCCANQHIERFSFWVTHATSPLSRT